LLREGSCGATFEKAEDHASLPYSNFCGAGGSRIVGFGTQCQLCSGEIKDSSETGQGAEIEAVDQKAG
jgi:hypothetical protein